MIDPISVGILLVMGFSALLGTINSVQAKRSERKQELRHFMDQYRTFRELNKSKDVNGLNNLLEQMMKNREFAYGVKQFTNNTQTGNTLNDWQSTMKSLDHQVQDAQRAIVEYDKETIAHAEKVDSMSHRQQRQMNRNRPELENIGGYIDETL